MGVHGQVERDDRDFIALVVRDPEARGARRHVGRGPAVEEGVLEGIGESIAHIWS